MSAGALCARALVYVCCLCLDPLVAGTDLFLPITCDTSSLVNVLILNLEQIVLNSLHYHSLHHGLPFDVYPLTRRHGPCLPLYRSDLLFGLPVTLDVPSHAKNFQVGETVELTDAQGQTIAYIEVESRWTPNKPKEAKQLYGTTSLEHPGVQMLSMEKGHDYVGGKVTGVRYPERVFPCETPAEVRAKLPETGDVVAFQCRNPIHRAHFELFIRALGESAPDPNPPDLFSWPAVWCFFVADCSDVVFDAPRFVASVALPAASSSL